MVASETISSHKSFPKLKQRINSSAFKKLLDKRPMYSRRITVEKAENEALEKPAAWSVYSRRSTVEKAEKEALEKPAICNAIPADEGHSSGENEIEKLMRFSLPSFLMKMLHSHVIKGFWLGIPKLFCAQHLPENNAAVTLVAEDGKPFQVKFKSERNAFSGGWKAFAEHHNLEVDDELFFELIQPCNFKVEIMRIYGTAG